MSLPLRRRAVWDENNQKQIVLLTNHHKLTASIVADIYKDRWEIELSFKTFKQNLEAKPSWTPAAVPWKPRFGQP
ncbi:hypothetical protein DFAR_1470017 [Desulfarculales bacterium]